MTYKKIAFSLPLILLLLLVTGFTFVQAETPDSNNVNIVSEKSGNRIAPGEFLPISVKLVNFGSERRTDVIINYKIFSDTDKDVFYQKEVYSESETVAVETTASFVKRIQIPYYFKPGLYTLVTVLHYPYQEDPAVSKTPFLVEEKIGGFFKSDLTIYSVFLLLVLVVTILITVVLTYIFRRNRRSYGLVHFDYSDKPKDQIIYYEMLTDILSQMRLHIGDKALELAKETPGLKVNDKTGMIIDIKKQPAEIISSLILKYENLTGQSLSFNVGSNKF